MPHRKPSVIPSHDSEVPPITVIIADENNELVAHITVHDRAALEFADRLAARGAIPSLEDLIAGAVAEYVGAPDRLIREMQRGGHRRAKKPAKPRSASSPRHTTTTSEPAVEPTRTDPQHERSTPLSPERAASHQEQSHDPNAHNSGQPEAPADAGTASDHNHAPWPDERAPYDGHGW